jgi:hypothetical protein
MNVDELEAFIDEGILRSIKGGYNPTIFVGMRARYGTVKAITRLVQSGEIQSGFKRLKELGLLEWSIESAIIKFPHRFTANARECAEFRLRLAHDEIERAK